MADAVEFSLVSTKTSRMALDLEGSMSFSEFPDDVQLNILSFLRPIEMSAFACTCRRFAALCSPSSPSNDLWLALCERRWGYKTEIRRWSAIPSPRLYKTLDRWEQLIGFWRRIVNGIPRTPPLVFFEWSPSCIIGSRISPSSFAASYAVRKVPFLWLGLSAGGETLSYVHLDNPLSDSDLIPVTIRLVGSNHFVVEETPTFCVHPKMVDSEEVLAVEAGSPPDRVMSEIYQYFANRTSPGAEKSFRRQRKKKKERLGRKKWEAEHFAKISNYFPTPARPLQGLWKGISKEMSLEFYLVTHDDFGGIACRRVGNSSEPFSGYSLVFWTSNTTFLEPPFSKEEHAIYSMREHIGSVHCNTDRELVSRILCINCSYDQVLPDLAGSSGDPRNVEGRIWEYEDGTFGFGFLRNNFIIDLKHIALDGYILDNLESSHPSHHVL